MAEREISPVDAQSVVRATFKARKRAEHVLYAARGLKEDHEQAIRHSVQLCPCCFYVLHSQVAGSAITHARCGLCLTECTYPSTLVDRLCSPCAKKNELCKRCGADIDLRENRSLATRERGHG